MTSDSHGLATTTLNSGIVGFAPLPKNNRIQSRRIPLQHLVIQLGSILGLRLQLAKVLNILDGGIAIVNAVYRTRALVTGNDGGRLKSDDLPQSVDPRLSLFCRGGFHQPLMELVVADVARDHHVEVWNVEKARIVGVRVSDLDNGKLMTFESDDPVWAERLHASSGRLLELIGKPGRPEVPPRGSLLSLHVLDRIRSRHGACLGKVLQDGA